ncbi:MAG: GNAT family N-acetyltransferase [Anaerolineaceae bacterium]|nr:GNAT family N-acetyltransferase [Anaerolineaceae bacterium]
MSETWQLSLQPLTAAHVEQILTWHYEPPYDLYDMSIGPPDAVALAEALDYFLRPEYHFQAMIRQPSGELAAFCSFGQDGQVSGGDYSAEAVDIGMGVHPKYTGRGLGPMFAGAAVDYALKTFAPPRLRVTIAEFNRRAQKVWQRHDFVPVQRFLSSYGKRPFIIFVRECG